MSAVAAALGCGAALVAPAAPVVALEPRAVTAAGAPVAVRVVGSSLVDASGRALRLRGVNRAGSEFACAQGWGLFDGPTDNTSIAAMTSWGVNAVRLPLNESCWLGINGVSTQYGGQSYQNAIAGFVQRLHAAGLAVVLDLHWNAPGTQKATGQQVMADADHAPAFWSSVATRFVGDPGVVFDLYNEPHDVSWQCWRNGCTTAEGWRTAGMQTLLDAVRATGARQPVLAGGLGWASDLSHWLAYRPTDPAGQLGASAHIYNFSQCNNETCWDGSIGQVAKMVPVLTGELGSNDCATGFINRYLDWADRHNVNYLGWTWNTWDCNSGPALISSYDGTDSAWRGPASTPTHCRHSPYHPGLRLRAGLCTLGGRNCRCEGCSFRRRTLRHRQPAGHTSPNRRQHRSASPQRRRQRTDPRQRGATQRLGQSTGRRPRKPLVRVRAAAGLRMVLARRYLHPADAGKLDLNLFPAYVHRMDSAQGARHSSAVHPDGHRAAAGLRRRRSAEQLTARACAAAGQQNLWQPATIRQGERALPRQVEAGHAERTRIRDGAQHRTDRHPLLGQSSRLRRAGKGGHRRLQHDPLVALQRDDGSEQQHRYPQREHQVEHEDPLPSTSGPSAQFRATTSPSSWFTNA